MVNAHDINSRSFKEYIEYIHKVEENAELHRAMIASSEFYLSNFENISKKYNNYLKKLREEVKKIKEYSLNNIDKLIEILRENLERHGIHFYYAETAEDARKIIENIIGDNKNIVKAKSITLEELEIKEYLKEKGKNVYETVIGDFIVQSLNTKPSYYTSPALHVTTEEVSGIIEKASGKKVSPDKVEELVYSIREILRNIYVKADVGITGANVIAADPGYIYIIENQNNARLVAGLPKKHIVVAGIEKIVPTAIDATKIIDLIVKYSGLEAISYISIIGGPSKTGHVGRKLVLGAQGPREVHVVILDNGRRKVWEDPILNEVLYCMKCGACLHLCPIYRLLGCYWNNGDCLGGIGIVWRYVTGKRDLVYHPALLCIGDQGCIEQCPLGINIPRMLHEILKRIHMDVFKESV